MRRFAGYDFEDLARLDGLQSRQGIGDKRTNIANVAGEGAQNQNGYFSVSNVLLVLDVLVNCHKDAEGTFCRRQQLAVGFGPVPGIAERSRIRVHEQQR